MSELETVEDVISGLFEYMDFDVLVKWADLLGVYHGERRWLDDEWPERESKLRVAVSEALIKFLGQESQLDKLAKKTATSGSRRDLKEYQKARKERTK